MEPVCGGERCTLPTAWERQDPTGRPDPAAAAAAVQGILTLLGVCTKQGILPISPTLRSLPPRRMCRHLARVRQSTVRLHILRLPCLLPCLTTLLRTLMLVHAERAWPVQCLVGGFSPCVRRGHAAGAQSRLLRTQLSCLPCLRLGLDGVRGARPLQALAGLSQPWLRQEGAEGAGQQPLVLLRLAVLYLPGLVLGGRVRPTTAVGALLCATPERHGAER